MKKYSFIYKVVTISVVLGLCAAQMSCKKSDAAPPTSPIPIWKADAIGLYPYSMTAVVSPSTPQNTTIGVNDQLGAFVNGECRGTGTIKTIGTASAFFILVHGNASENSPVVWKYYNAKSSVQYVASESVNFQVDSNIGTVDSPRVVKFNVGQ